MNSSTTAFVGHKRDASGILRTGRWLGIMCMITQSVSRQAESSEWVRRVEEEMLQQAQERAGLPGPDEEVGATEAEARELHSSAREYRVPSTGAKVSLASAKSLLYQYCNMLPCDRCTCGARLCTSLKKEDRMHA